MFIRILSLKFRSQHLFNKQNDTLKSTPKRLKISKDVKINKQLRVLPLLFLFPLSLAYAQIQTDGSMGSAQSLTGPDFVISEALGQRSGSNLFHSFSEFNVHKGESATFTGASDITNVISRVTGGKLSNIDGLLKSEIANANLYLINPAGILFGPNSSLSINGSFHTSTADFIRLGDADLFYSEPLQGEILSTAAPTAFGFFGAPKGGITLDGGRLSVNNGEVVSLIGGNLSLKNNSRVIATSGQINLVSLQSQGEARIGINDDYPYDIDI